MHTGDISLVRRIHTGRWGVAVWAAHRPVPAPVPVTGTERVASRYRGSGVPVVTARLVAAALMWHRHSISSRTRAQSSHPAEQHCERQTAQSTASTLPPTRTVPHPTPPLKAATSETSGVPRAPQAACTCTVLRARHNKFQTPTAPPSLLPLAAALERPRAASTCCAPSQNLRAKHAITGCGTTRHGHTDCSTECLPAPSSSSRPFPCPTAGAPASRHRVRCRAGGGACLRAPHPPPRSGIRRSRCT